VLDFQKVIQDGNNVSQEESLETYVDFAVSLGKGDTSKPKPIMTFKKVNRSPEFKLNEYSRASRMQKLLWTKYTTQKERYYLWFYLFSPYFRMKLWNRLQFSDEYVMNLMNSAADTRQDVVVFITGRLDKIREEYLEFLLAILNSNFNYNFNFSKLRMVLKN